MTSVRNRLDAPQEEIGAAVHEALAAVARAHVLLRATGDPLAAAVDSAVTCAVSLIALHKSGYDANVDVDALRDALGAARALVGEVTFAVRDRISPTADGEVSI
jgi:hypothetical protein